MSREAFSALFHVALLLALVTLLRSWFFRAVDDAHYRAPSIFVSMARSDWALILGGAKKHQPVVPEILAFFLPPILFYIARRKLRWTSWTHGKSLRVLMLLVVLMLCWSGATSPYNVYLGREHGLDRWLLVACAALSIRYPIFVPPAVRMAIVLIKEAYVPIALDDFDFRAPAEFAVIFSIFVWASISRSFKPAHFLVAGIGSLASYYYLAGTAKLAIGPAGSWLNDNHVSNISVAGYVRGWASFLPESVFLKIAAVARKLDYPFALYTLVIELGALVAFYVDRRLTRLWILGCFLLNFGIFVLTGICFWKWMTLTLGMFLWMGRIGRPLTDEVLRLKLPLLLAVASIYWSAPRIWYFPQTHVVWYDTRMVENYEIYAIGKSGQRYLVSPTFFRPMDMHWTQGRLCYATEKERQLTGIYGTSGSHQTMMALETATPEAAFQMKNRARPCQDAKKQAAYDDFMKRYFGNLNRTGRKLAWMDWLGRPKHLWVFPKGELDGGNNVLYDGQEKVSRIELWLTVVYHQGSRLHRRAPKLTHSVDIPD